MGPAPHTLEFTNQRGTQGKKQAITSSAGECSRGGRQPCSCLVGAKRKAFFANERVEKACEKVAVYQGHPEGPARVQGQG